jgi:hypothetical protein
MIARLTPSARSKEIVNSAFWRVVFDLHSS